MSSLRYEGRSAELFDTECACFGHECRAQSGIDCELFGVGVM